MTVYECVFCNEEFKDTKPARQHMEDDHADEVFDEAWPRYFTEVDG